MSTPLPHWTLDSGAIEARWTALEPTLHCAANIADAIMAEYLREDGVTNVRIGFLASSLAAIADMQAYRRGMDRGYEICGEYAGGVA